MKSTVSYLKDKTTEYNGKITVEAFSTPTQFFNALLSRDKNSWSQNKTKFGSSGEYMKVETGFANAVSSLPKDSFVQNFLDDLQGLDLIIDLNMPFESEEALDQYISFCAEADRRLTELGMPVNLYISGSFVDPGCHNTKDQEMFLFTVKIKDRTEQADWGILSETLKTAIAKDISSSWFESCPGAKYLPGYGNNLSVMPDKFHGLVKTTIKTVENQVKYPVIFDLSYSNLVKECGEQLYKNAYDMSHDAAYADHLSLADLFFKTFYTAKDGPDGHMPGLVVFGKFSPATEDINNAIISLRDLMEKTERI